MKFNINILKSKDFFIIIPIAVIIGVIFNLSFGLHGPITFVTGCIFYIIIAAIIILIEVIENKMKRILNYIDDLKNGSFEGWSDEAKKGYLTACVSIEEKIKETFENEEIDTQVLEVLLEERKKKAIDDWIKFYDSAEPRNEVDGFEVWSKELDMQSLALGFFISKGLSFEDAFNLYHTECIQLGKF